MDLTRLHGLGPAFALKLVAACGTDLSAWPTAKHCVSWLCLSPGNQVSGGKLLSARTRRTSNRATSWLRLAALTVARTDSALGACYRRLALRVGKAKAITATARKLAILCYNTWRHGRDYSDPVPPTTRNAIASACCTPASGGPSHSAMSSSRPCVRIEVASPGRFV